MGTCAACLAETPDGARFCPACGARQDDRPAPAPRSERRIVTTLFCDLVDFTALCESADPEDIDALLRSYHRLARETVEQYGGVLEKFVGDGAVGAFGASAAHEDDAERAVRAAVRLQARIRELSGPGGSPVRARIGINTGEVLVRLDVDPASGENFLVGDAVNTAARLQTVAPPGGIAIGDLTHSLTRGVGACRALDPVMLKGKSLPARVWLVGGLVASPGVDLERSFEAPFVGREVELGELQGLFKKMVASQTPLFAHVVAEAGLGKSRLLHEVAAWVDRQPDILAWWRQAECPAFGEGLSAWPIARILRQHAGIVDADDPDRAEQKLRAVLSDAPDREWLLERLRPLVGLPSTPAPKENSFEAWLRFLELLAGAKPTVLVIEDLHWASPLMVDFVRHLGRAMPDVPLLGIFTWRPGLTSPWPEPGGREEAGLLAPRVTRLDLHPLSPRETRRLAVALEAEDDGLPVEEVVRRSGGNPLYAEVLVRLALESSKGGMGADGTQDPPAQAGIPPGLQSLIAARLDSLSPRQKALLSDAAVIGDEFDLATLSVVSDLPAPDHDDLTHLVERDLVRGVPPTEASAASRYAFQHALTREVAYAQLPRASRLRRHEKYGLWLAARQRDEDHVLASYHLRSALDLAREMDVDAFSRLRGPAVESLVRAADAMLVLDVRESERLSRQALELARVEDQSRADVLVLLGRCLHRAGQLREAEAAFTDALEALDEEDRLGHATVLMHLSDALLHLGEPRVIDVADRALSLLGGDPCPELVAALERRAALHLTEDEPEEARELAEAARRTAAGLGLPPPLRATEISTLASCLLGSVQSGMREADELRELISSPDCSDATASTYAMLAELALVYQGPEAALELSSKGRRLADERHDFTSSSLCRTAELEDRFFLGQWHGLMPALDQLAEILADTESLFGLSDIDDFRTALAATTGVPLTPPVRRPLHELESELHGSFSLTYLVLALEAGAAGRSEEAVGLLTKMDAHTARFSAIPSLMLWWNMGVRLALDLGAPAVAARLAETPLASPATPHPAAAAATAALAEARGELDEAAPAYARSARAWHDHGVPFEYGHALLAQARCLCGLARGSESLPLIEQAHTVFRRLGAAPSLTAAGRWQATARTAG